MNVYQKVLRIQACEIEERYGQSIFKTNGTNNIFLKFIQRKNDRRMCQAPYYGSMGKK